MTGNGDRLKINEPTIVHENIDGETIILNLDTGHYYSTVETGADIWECLAKEMPVADMLALMRSRYLCSGGEEESLHAFLSELEREGLIAAVAADQVDAPLDAAQSQPVLDPSGEREKSFSPPLLNKYTDMKDLLLLDPIHEVDAAGWPSTKPTPD